MGDNESIESQWERYKAELVGIANPYESNPELLSLWERLCEVPPVRLALVHLNKPSDLAVIAQMALMTSRKVPHLCSFMVGQTMDYSHYKVTSKVESWGVKREDIRWLPRTTSTLESLKRGGFRLVGTSPHTENNALNFGWSSNDVFVIGGANGLSKQDLGMMDEVVTIPCGRELPFLTTDVVVPVLTTLMLKSRGFYG